jgi:TPP-dependent pyruvate/acetoin dehydrogenase alpha subunit
MDVNAVMLAAEEATASIRRGDGPVLLVCETYRFRAHSMFDAELYREKTEVEEWKERDPIALFAEQVALSAEETGAMDREIAAEVQRAIDHAEAGTWEPVDDLLRDVTTATSPKR